MKTFPGIRVENSDADAGRPCIVAARTAKPPFAGTESDDDLVYSGPDCWDYWQVYLGFSYIGTDAGGKWSAEMVVVVTPFRGDTFAACGLAVP
jgi:hypothetical protein